MREALIAMLTVVTLVGSASASAATWYVDGAMSAFGDGKSWESAFRRIQYGIEAASHGDTVIVAKGTYVQNIDFGGKNIILRSTDPLDSDVVQNTIIDGNNVGSVVTFEGSEDETCVLSGFTIRYGEGFSGGVFGNGTHARIQHNLIVNNTAESSGGGIYHCDGVIDGNTIYGNNAPNGGGMANCDGRIRSNIIKRNSAQGGGGGLASCDGTIEHNTITLNSADNGGGLSGCDGTIQNNTIVENTATEDGGGLRSCSGTIQNNTISSNTTGDRGGGLAFCHATIQRNTITLNLAWEGGGLCACGPIDSNLIAGNRADAYGGGLSLSFITVVQNNTIVGNSSGKGGGLYCLPIAEDADIHNCIIWGNAAPEGAQLSNSKNVTYSCIQDWAGGGTGNTNGDPRFLDRDGPDNDMETYEDNDYRLSAGSPCIDRGDNTDLNPPGLDLDGNLRIVFGEHSLTVDMGAYEYNSGPLQIQEILRLGASAVRLLWRSQPNDTYTIWSRADLLTGTWIEQGTVPSHGAETPWTDATATGQVKFYRVEMK